MYTMIISRRGKQNHFEGFIEEGNKVCLLEASVENCVYVPCNWNFITVDVQHFELEKFCEIYFPLHESEFQLRAAIFHQITA